MHHSSIDHYISLPLVPSSSLSSLPQNFKEEAKKQRQLIQKLEMEREGYSKEAMDTKHRCIEQVSHINRETGGEGGQRSIVCLPQMEEVKRKEMELYQLKKRIAGHESKLKQQQVRASVQ